MDHYLEALDRHRMYLLESDVDYIEKFRYRLDDVVRSQPLDPVFDIFSLYRTRVRERFEFALSQLEIEPDLAIDEEYQFDRVDVPWAQSTDELDELWRKRVKNDVLNLALTDKEWIDCARITARKYRRTGHSVHSKIALSACHRE